MNIALLWNHVHVLCNVSRMIHVLQIQAGSQRSHSEDVSLVRGRQGVTQKTRERNPLDEMMVDTRATMVQHKKSINML